MAEVKNAFIKSKMNKDLDDRLIPSGEYRDALNVQVSKSEASDVGALENILGNSVAVDFGALVSVSNLKCIGFFVDEFNSEVFSFFTNNTDPSVDNITYDASAENFIFRHNINTLNTRVLVRGAFLNFSTTNPIIGVNLLEELLFFTDNRNQPRKINVTLANLANTMPGIINPSYYFNEDQISVATYNPYGCIKVIEASTDSAAVVLSTTTTAASDTNVIAVSSIAGVDYGNGIIGAGVKTGTFVKSINGNSVTVNKTQDLPINAAISFVGLQTTMQDVSSVYLPNGGSASTNGVVNGQTTFPINNIKGDILVGSIVSGISVTAGTTVIGFTTSNNSLELSVAQNLVDKTSLVFNANPYYDNTFGGDPDFLEDKFVRFSYRFQFIDGENSIFAPFTQPCFIPKQDGYFIKEDEKQAFSSTVVGFMENKVTRIKLQIPLPTDASVLASPLSSLKIKAIDVLYKESDGLAVQVIETIPIDAAFGSTAGANNVYEYIYESTKPFKTLPSKELIRVYDKIPVRAFSQEIISNRVVYGNFQDKHTPPSGIDYQVSVFDKYEKNSPFGNKSTVEYPNSTIKQNRNYQVGIVLSDKFGRQSSTILSNNTSALTATGFGTSTVYSPYQEVSDTPAAEWPGDSLKVLFNSIIDSNKNLSSGTPGLYNGDTTDSNYNPLGWYSYKVVVQQKEQDYYNVYSAGAMKGSPTDVTKNLNTSYITLLNDNINKVPRDLSEVGPLQKQFRSSVRLIGRVENTQYATSLVGNQQFYPGRLTDTTSSIEDLNSIFDVSGFKDNTVSNPASQPITSNANAFFPFYKSESDPLVAQITTTREFGLLNTPDSTLNPSTYAAIENLTIFETEPDLSRLDFYFETSTSGLISELNGAINTNLGGAFGIENFNFLQTEAYGLDVEVVSGFYPTDLTDSPLLNSSITFTAFDGEGTDKTNNWALESYVEPVTLITKYNLSTSNNANGYQVYGDSPFQAESYTFDLKVYDVDNDNVETSFQRSGVLTNVAPTITSGAIQTINKPFGETGVISAQAAVNGSNAGGGNTTLGLTWSIVSEVQPPQPNGNQTPYTAFAIDSSTGEISFSSTQSTVAPLSGQYTLVIRVTDSGGAYYEATLTLTFGNSPIPSRFDIPVKTLGDGEMVRYYFTNPNNPEGKYEDLDEGNDQIFAPYRFPDNDNTSSKWPNSTPSATNGDYVSTYVCGPDTTPATGTTNKYLASKEYRGDWFEYNNAAAFYVAIKTVNKGGTSSKTVGTSASVEWRNLSSPGGTFINWKNATDISGQPSSFGMSPQLNSSGGIIQSAVRVNSSGEATTTFPASTDSFYWAPKGTTSYNPPGSIYTQSLLQTTSNSGNIVESYRVFVFNGNQDGYDDGEYRITLGNLSGQNLGYSVAFTGGPSSYVDCSGTLDTDVTQSIEIGDAMYPEGGQRSYAYQFSPLGTTQDSTCATSILGNHDIYYAREWITKYVTQLYTNATLMDEVNSTTQPNDWPRAARRKFRRVGVNQEQGIDGGSYTALFTIGGRRQSFSSQCLSTNL